MSFCRGFGGIACLLLYTVLAILAEAQHPPPTNLIFHTVFSRPCDNCEETCSQSTGTFIEGECYASPRQSALAGMERQSRWYKYRVVRNIGDGSLQVCKSTYTDSSCGEAAQASDCWDTADDLAAIEWSWAREPATTAMCLNKTVVRDEVLEREIFNVHLDWCTPNDHSTLGLSNIFSHGSSDYTIPLIVNRFYPDEESCDSGTNEIQRTELPAARVRSRYLVDQELCVTENRTRYGSLRYYCNRNVFFREEYTGLECQGQGRVLLAGECFRNFDLDGETVLRWSRVDCNEPLYYCKDVANVAPFRYNRMERPSASPTNVPSGVPSSDPTVSGAPSASPTSLPTMDPSSSSSPSNQLGRVPSSTPTVSGAPSASPTSIPTREPSSAPSIVPTVPLTPEVRMERIKDFLIEQGISSETDLSLEGSPQEQALQFIAVTDELQVPIPAGNKTTPEGYAFLTRYVLAILYYANGGDRSWTHGLNFLTGVEICYWYSVLQYADLSQEFRGVACNDDSEITALFLKENKLMSALPKELGLLTTLTAIDFDQNQLQGSIPETLQTLHKLEQLFASGNTLTGELPSWIGMLSTIRNINLSHNLLTGTLTSAFGYLTELEGIALDNNLFSGTLEGFLDPAGLQKLEQVYLEHNQLSGTIRDTFLMGSNLTHLDISDNQLGGSVSMHLFELPNLVVLDLHDNEFDFLANNIPINSNLKLLALQKCSFANQTIPTTVSNLHALQHLDLSQNSFSGLIPDEIGNMFNLTYIFLAQNNFVPGPIPSWVLGLTDLKELSLKSTKRTGAVPLELGRTLAKLVLLDLDNNLLEGEIPDTLGLLSNLNILTLNRNKFTSEIPRTFADLTGLKLLYLDANTEISGSLNNLFCSNLAFPRKAVIVADCDICDMAVDGCCVQCCESGEECNQGVYVPDLDPVWQLDYGRVFFVFGRDDFFARDQPPEDTVDDDGIVAFYETFNRASATLIPSQPPTPNSASRPSGSHISTLSLEPSHAPSESPSAGSQPNPTQSPSIGSSARPSVALAGSLVLGPSQIPSHNPSFIGPSPKPTQLVSPVPSASPLPNGTDNTPPSSHPMNNSSSHLTNSTTTRPANLENENEGGLNSNKDSSSSAGTRHGLASVVSCLMLPLLLLNN